MCGRYYDSQLLGRIWRLFNFIKISRKCYKLLANCIKETWFHLHFIQLILTPSLPSFLPSLFLRYCAIYRLHLKERDPIWDDDKSHSPSIRLSLSWCFLGFSTAVRQMPGDLCTASRIVSLSPLSLATDVTDATLGASGL